MMTPKTEWGSDDHILPDGVIWRGELDDRFLTEVHRTGTYGGTLVVFDHLDGDKVLIEEPVGLTYGATFGPDVSDVHAWQVRVVEYVDEHFA